MKQPKKKTFNTFPKIITTIVVVHGMINVDLSYILAFFDKEPVCEVSVAMISEIVAPIVVYLATNLIANIFEKNYLSFSIPRDSDWVIDKRTRKRYNPEEDV